MWHLQKSMLMPIMMIYLIKIIMTKEVLLIKNNARENRLMMHLAKIERKEKKIAETYMIRKTEIEMIIIKLMVI